MKSLKIVPLFLIALASMGCSGGAADQASTPASVGSSSGSAGKKGAMENDNGLSDSRPSPKLASQNFSPKAVSRSVIRNGSLTVRVADVEAAERKITAWVTESGGFVSTSDSTNLSEPSPTLNMTLRVPVSRFDAAFQTIENMGARMAKKISGEDVTADAVDLDARLGIMRAQEQSFRNSLARMSDQSGAYDMQTRLMDLRGQIESLTSQRKKLADLATLSTLEVTLVGSAKGMAQTEDSGWAREAWNSATSALGAVLQVLGSFLIVAIVFCPVWFPVVFFGWRAVRKSALKGA